MSILELTGTESCKECGERGRAERDRLQTENDKLVIKLNAEHIVRQNVDVENDRLRELVRDMHRAICGLVVLGDDYAGEYEDRLCALDDRMLELGVDE